MRELSLNVMDVVQNSISAGAGLIAVTVAEDTAARRLSIGIDDDGRGMSAQVAAQVQDPFYTTRTTRKVGLGIPFFKMAAEMTGGGFSIESQPGAGTRVLATFCTDHIDMVPLGDLNETVLLLIAANPDLDFIYTHSRDGASFALDTRELREVLGGEVSLADPQVIAWIKEYLAEGSAELT